MLCKPLTLISTQSSKVNGGNLNAACLLLVWGLEDYNTFSLSASLSVCEKETERHRQNGCNLVLSPLSKFTPPGVLLCQDERASALDVANIITVSFILSERGRPKCKQCPFVRRRFLPWLLSLGTQGPSVPTSSWGDHSERARLPRAPGHIPVFSGNLIFLSDCHL